MADRSSIITPTLRHFWDLIWILTQKELKVRYKSSVLGYVWSIANPLAFAFTFYVAFKVVMRIQMEDYALFLISGLFPWQWLANSITFSTGVFLANASIIKKVSFPRSSVVLTTVLQDMIHFVLAMPVIVLFLFLYGRSPSLSWLWGIPLFLSAQFCLTYGLCLAVSSANLFFRDLERLVGILLNLIFYFTPILYPESLVPAEYRGLANANPFAPLMTGWRKLFMYGELDLALLATSAAFGGVALLGGYTIYRKLSWRFAEVL